MTFFTVFDNEMILLFRATCVFIAATIAIGGASDTHNPGGDRTLEIVSVAVSAILRGLNSAIATADSEVTIDLHPCPCYMAVPGT